MQPVELAADLLRLGFAGEVVGFELGALGLEIGEIVLGRAQRLFLRQQVSCGRSRGAP